MKKLREFHNFNVVFKDNQLYEVVAFTAAQIPGIAGRIYPASLAGPLYPDGIPIYDESKLPEIIKEKNVDLVVFSYSDLTHEELMHKASLVLALGADFLLLGPKSTMLRPSKKTIAVTAVKTGAGKSTISRYFVKLLREMGLKPVVVRHPMPYGVLEKQVVQRFSTYADLDEQGCSIEEREEIEPHLRENTIVYAGVDYLSVLKEAEMEGDVILWDGGNNDFPFFRPDLHVTVVDATRPGLETSSYPGETNILMADLIIIHKADKSSAEKIEELKNALHHLNPRAEIVVTGSTTCADEFFNIKGKRVAVIEDGPSVTHGGMAVGAAFDYAVKAGAEVVDPKPYAVGAIAEMYKQYGHIGPVVPAIGYTLQQLRDLEETLKRISADTIVSSSPADLSKIIRLNKPYVKVWFEAVQLSGKNLSDIIRLRLLES
ncbi:MAG: cyclic 2,3-diphosphoglycerate synthase [Candidatus Caldarchaeum sp.]